MPKGRPRKGGKGATASGAATGGAAAIFREALDRHSAAEAESEIGARRFLFSEALRLYNEALAVTRTFPLVYNSGLVLLELARDAAQDPNAAASALKLLEDSAARFRDALTDDPANNEVLNNLGCTLSLAAELQEADPSIQDGLLTEAEQCFAKAWESVKTDPDVVVNWGECFQQLASVKHKLGIPGVPADPFFQLANDTFAMADRMQGVDRPDLDARWGSMLVTYADISQDPAAVRALYYRAAEMLLRAAQTGAPVAGLAAAALVECGEREPDQEKAYAFLREAISIAPAGSSHQGDAFLAYGRAAKDAAALEQAIAVYAQDGSNSIESRYNAACALALLGRSDECRAALAACPGLSVAELQADPDLAGMRSAPWWTAMVGP